MQSVIRNTNNFAELLSLGFATIGVRATVLAVTSQLLEDAISGAHRQRHPAMTEA
jgi:hypothetical protein